MPATCTLDVAELPAAVTTILLPPPEPGDDAWAGRLSRAAGPSHERSVIVEVLDAATADAALRAGADGLIAKGLESGGRIGTETTFVLLQRLLASSPVPVWAQGGIGVRAAAACRAMGAAGVLLDSQLALVRESTVVPEVRAALRAMDGSETVEIAGYRVYWRPDLPVARGAVPQDAAGVAEKIGADDLRRNLLPVGQEGAFAAPLARAHGSAGGVVQAFLGAMRSAVSSAVAAGALEPGRGVAAVHGLRYPVAQGPMTRVSDQPEFALAVAEAGGLPFLALALLNGEQARDLLRRTADLLGDRPWGAGILGFVPADLRERQLAALLETPPPVALVAGGRPSATRPLEAAGIATYLHVPSPGLLDQFVAAGARRFVFEGRECGGHVGPRGSFALWEAQIARLAEARDLEQMSVLFAGGIHDARSAAAVAAMAAPLAARGAAIGVLMGTAYLFTEEAVESGAITPAFQEAALSCSRTVLLETSPGHATRCAESAYVDAFRAERARLEEAGASQKELWAALETMNLGRLRIAAKGLRREGDVIAAVSAQDQRAEGMFMIGEVAALRRAVTTVASLHENVSAGATAFLAARAGREADRGVAVDARGRFAGPEGSRPVPDPLDIAVVGMACLFPGAHSAEELWANVVDRVDGVTEVPTSRWSAERYFDPTALTAGAGKRTPSKWGGFLDPEPFDPLRYGIPPAALTAIEPVQLLSLEVAARALADAGYAERVMDRSRVSVIFGAEAGTDLAGAYGFRAQFPQLLGDLPPELDAWLPSLTEDSFPGVLANVIAGRIANRLDLGGVNYTVDAACASSLAAVDLACKELAAGSSDMVLCGGADLHNGIADYLLFAAVHALSPTGRCRSFDSAADGIALGEGVACVVLKRRSDALRDGDRIYAVINGIGGSSDGRSLGLTAPRPEGQRSALERAYARSGVSPAEVGVVEAHGTGTVVGDRTELAVLSEVFSAAGAPPGSCTLGSVKSQIGHTKCAAGMAGLIKSVEAVYRGVRPPTLHIEAPNPGYKPGVNPFVFVDRAQPWTGRVPRRAGVSAFGFGGTNFHVVVSSDDEEELPPHGVAVWPAELFCFRGSTPDEARRSVHRLAGIVGPPPSTADLAAQAPPSMRRSRWSPWKLADLACTVDGWGTGSVQIAVVARDVDDLRAKLAGIDAAGTDLDADAGSATEVFVAPASGLAGAPVAFLFPGQGSQRPGMLSDLFVTFTRIRRFLDLDGFDPHVMLPPAAFDAAQRRAQDGALTDTLAAQPALGVAGLAMADLLGACGVHPDMAGGHSYGELVALSVGGAIDEEDLPRLSAARAQAMLDGVGDDPGTMAAVAGSAAEVHAALSGLAQPHGIVVANDNAPAQVVISGPTRDVDDAVAHLKAQGLASRRIPVACAFHSSVVAGAVPAFRAALDAVEVATPKVPVWANSTAEPYAGDAAIVRSTLAGQLARPVRFREQVEAMYAAGARIFVEAGPGRVLSQLVGRVLAGRPHLAVATDVPGDDGVRRFLVALAQLAVNGVAVNTGALFTRRAEALDEAVLADSARPAWTVDGQMVRAADGRPLAGGLQPVDTRPVSLTMRGPAGGDGATAVQTREAALVAYFESMRRLVDTQSDVVLAYLGAPAPGHERRPDPAPGPAIADPSAGTHSADGAAVGSGVASASGAARAQEAGAGGAALSGDDLLDALLTLVSDRTGYPREMLAPDLDLEADLSIDSIKRLEILGDLVESVGLAGTAGPDGPDEGVIEELVGHKTLRSIVAWIDAHSARSAASNGASGNGSETAAPSSGGPVAEQDGLGGGDADAGRGGVETLVVTTEVLPPLGTPRSDGGRGPIAVVGGGSLGARVAERLDAQGRTVYRQSTGVDLAPGASAVALVDLSLVDGDGGPAVDALAGLFVRTKEALGNGVATLLVVSELGGVFGRRSASGAATNGARGGAARLPIAAGVRGFVKTIAIEYPDRRVRAVDTTPGEDEERRAGQIVSELLAIEGGVDAVDAVGYLPDGARLALGARPGGLEGDAAEPGLAAGDGHGALVDPEAVVLITGGGRGIGARAAVAMARASRCTVVVAGRTVPDTASEPAEVAGAADLVALRRALAAGGAGRTFASPAEIEREGRRILANREVQVTMGEIAAAGATAHYEVVDTADAAAVAGLVESVYERFGRIDGVIHAAGVIEDRLVADKDAASFRRVVATKAAGAEALATALRDDARFLVFYSSISGIFGNRGQVDYAAANDALGVLAHRLGERWPGRVSAIAWGPWAGGGMVTPELARSYARRGVGLIDPDEGIGVLTRTIACLVAGCGVPELVVVGLAGPSASPATGGSPAAESVAAGAGWHAT